MENNLNWAINQDHQDPFSNLRNSFELPQLHPKETLYFCGHSLGPKPKNATQMVIQELEDWGRLGVEGHFDKINPWVPYHEFVTPSMAKLVGAKVDETIVMNSLTTNLHLLMMSFYRPQGKRTKVIMEKGAFCSDIYAISSHLEARGIDPKKNIIEISPREGEDLINEEDIYKVIYENKSELELILFGGVNYLTGQVFQMEKMTKAGHQVGAKVGFDLAHAVGNVPLKLHDWNVDFAIWCTYKYLNAGPGSIGAAYINEKYLTNHQPRFAGWWGQDKVTRFKMENTFNPIKSAEGWQLSNPPILQLAALRASMEVFDQISTVEFSNRSNRLTGYLDFIIRTKNIATIVTPKEEHLRGCMLCLKIDSNKNVNEIFKKEGLICDFRSPNIIRLSANPLYSNFQEVYKVGNLINQVLG